MRYNAEGRFLYMEYNSPVTIVHNAMHMHTDRKPADNEAVVGLMSEARTKRGQSQVVKLFAGSKAASSNKLL